MEAIRYEGTLGGIPQNVSSLVVYWNRGLFKKLGVPPPKPDWSWYDFRKTAQALTRDEDGDGRTDLHGLAFEPNLSRLAPFIWQAGDPPTAAYDVAARPRRQDLTPEARRYRETGSLYLTRTEVYEQHDNRLGGRVGLVVRAAGEGTAGVERDDLVAQARLQQHRDVALHRGRDVDRVTRIEQRLRHRAEERERRHVLR